jgi:hypothetical protein
MQLDHQPIASREPHLRNRQHVVLHEDGGIDIAQRSLSIVDLTRANPELQITSEDVGD